MTKGWKSVVTFEKDGSEPLVVRGEISVPDADTAAQRAVFRALPEVKQTKYDSVVIVLERQ